MANMTLTPTLAAPGAFAATASLGQSRPKVQPASAGQDWNRHLGRI